MYMSSHVVGMALERNQNIVDKQFFRGIYRMGNIFKWLDNDSGYQIRIYDFSILNENTGNKQCERIDGSVNRVIGSGI